MGSAELLLKGVATGCAIFLLGLIVRAYAQDIQQQGFTVGHSIVAIVGAAIFFLILIGVWI
jgi:Na+/melibiose symporter-like transporter